MSYPFTDQIGPDARIRASRDGAVMFVGRLGDFLDGYDMPGVDFVSPAQKADLIAALAKGDGFHDDDFDVELDH